MPRAELASLKVAIEVCRQSIAEHKRALISLSGREGEAGERQLVELYEDLLARQLRRSSELQTLIGQMPKLSGRGSGASMPTKGQLEGTVHGDSDLGPNVRRRRPRS